MEGSRVVRKGALKLDSIHEVGPRVAEIVVEWRFEGTCSGARDVVGDELGVSHEQVVGARDADIPSHRALPCVERATECQYTRSAPFRRRQLQSCEG